MKVVFSLQIFAVTANWRDFILGLGELRSVHVENGPESFHFYIPAPAHNYVVCYPYRVH